MAFDRRHDEFQNRILLDFGMDPTPGYFSEFATIDADQSYFRLANRTNASNFLIVFEPEELEE